MEDVMTTIRSTALPLNLPQYTQLICQFDEERSALWAYLDPKPRPCFTPTLLAEIGDLQNRIKAAHTAGHGDAVRYFIFASTSRHVFSLGGDVNLFAQLITSRDRDAMYRYGKACVDSVYADAVGFGVPDLTTISLVQGQALGGGFECALSCNVLIAEEQAKMGFPEILFNLFPGMGALSILQRKLGLREAEHMVSTGELYSAKYLFDVGAVDQLAPRGEGVYKVNEFIRRHRRAANGLLAIRAAAQRVSPPSYAELLDVVNIWVDAAMRLTARDLRTMHRLVAAQDRLSVGEDSAREVVHQLPGVTYARAVGA